MNLADQRYVGELNSQEKEELDLIDSIINLWWLNGKSKYMVPGSQTVYPTALVPNAPADMYAAMGAEDQSHFFVL